MPRFAGDDIAPSKLAQVLAIAERLDTLAGGFAAGLKPTGNKDPFALRRNALGLARTLIEGELDVPLRRVLAYACGLVAIDLADVPVDRLLDAAAELASEGVAVNAELIDRKIAATYDSANADPALIAELHDFVLERLRGYYADQGVTRCAFRRGGGNRRRRAGDAARLRPPPEGDRRVRRAARRRRRSPRPTSASATSCARPRT